MIKLSNIAADTDDKRDRIKYEWKASMRALQEHVDIINSGVENWNKWRKENKTTKPEFAFVSLQGAHIEGADLRLAHLEGIHLAVANLVGANLDGAHLEGANLVGANLRGANFSETDLEGVDLSKAKSFYKAKLDPNILSEIKTKWPEKLATLLDVRMMDWVIDAALLEQVKKPDWHGWPEGKDHRSRTIKPVPADANK